MEDERVVRISLVRTGSWVSGKVTVFLPGERRASASRPIAARVEDAPGELSELCEWALAGLTAQEGFWG